MIADRITNTATHHRYTASTKNEAGDVTYTFVDAPEPLYVELQQQSATEMRDGRAVLVSTWIGYFRPDAVLDGHDEMTLDGKRYSFDGDPWLVRHPRTGQASHWFARMRRAA